MGAPSFYGSEFDLRKLLKKIQQRCSQITCGERGTETNCESPRFATATCPCSSSKRVQLLDHRAPRADFPVLSPILMTGADEADRDTSGRARMEAFTVASGTLTLAARAISSSVRHIAQPTHR